MEKIKILIYDLETTPLISYSWGPKWETNLIDIIEQTQILSYSAKWLKGKHITKGLLDYKGYKKGKIDDKNIVKDIWNLLDQADVIIGQNNKSFDDKIMRSRFLFHKLPPTSPFKQIDTKTEAKKYIRLPSYSLDDMCDYFNIGRKKKHEGFNLWLECMNGNKSAFKRMLDYNKNDVILTEKLYLLLRPYMTTHPNIGILKNSNHVCPRCGGNNLQSRGYAINKTTRYRRIQCTDCGSWSRTTINLQEIKPLVAI